MCRDRVRRARLDPEERSHFLHEAGPRRLAFQQEVVASLEGHEPGARDERGQEPTFVVWDTEILRDVEHERRRGEPRREVADVQRVAGAQNPRRVLRGSRYALELVEPVTLLGTGLRNEHAGESLPE